MTLSCGKSEPENTEPTPTPKPADKVELAAGTDTNPTVPTEGGTITISFNASTAWTAQSVNDRADAWCTVSPASGNARAGTITITTKENTDTDERSASVTIKAGTAQQTIKVTQKQKDALTVTASTFEVPAEGQDINIEVKANVNVTYKIPEECKYWIKYISTKAMKTSTLTFVVSKNEDLQKREGKIIIGEGTLSDTVKVFQAGEAPSIVLNKNEYIAKSQGETFAIEVASNVYVNISILHPDGSPTWLTENTTRTMSTNTYWFTAAANQEYNSREAKIIFTNKENNLSDTVKVIQLQKDAIVFAQTEYEFGATGGELDLKVLIDMEINVEIPENGKDWIMWKRPEESQSDSLHFTIFPTFESEHRIGYIYLSADSKKQIITIKQDGIKETQEKERAALMDLYISTGGDNWLRNDNWCSDKPVSEWYGITHNGVGIIRGIDLSNNNLNGTIPGSIANLKHLEQLFLNGNKISGGIPEEICHLEKLLDLNLSGNRLSGPLPANIGNMKSLSTLYLDSSLPIEGDGSDINRNQISGEIPLSLTKLQNLSVLDITDNDLSGKIPDAIWSMPSLTIINLKGNRLEREITPAIANAKNLKQLILENNHLSGQLPNQIYELTQLEELSLGNYTLGMCGNYDKEHYNTFCGTISGDIQKMQQLAVLNMNDNNIEGTIPTQITQMPQLYSLILLGNRMNGTIDEKILADKRWTDTGGGWYPRTNILPQQNGYGFSVDQYESKDFSKDGNTTILQKSTTGAGINIVLMGDGYSDRLINNGTYDEHMTKTMEHFFGIEPYKSFRSYFNVYSVTAVSKHKRFIPEVSSTALGCIFFEINGDPCAEGVEKKVLGYAQKVIKETDIHKSLIIVTLNSTEHSGFTCIYPPKAKNNISHGLGISYISIGEDEKTLANIIHHEAGGHGFAKLADEQEIDVLGTIPEDYKAQHITEQTDYGWWKNIDFTNDKTLILWAKFLCDTRYKNEGIGIFEGGLLYPKGVYRATEKSIMRSMNGNFNAPSREDIYHRIHKLAYGTIWNYDYEKFVEYDVINRTTSSTYHTHQILPLEPIKHTRPVIRNNIEKSYRTRVAGND